MHWLKRLIDFLTPIPLCPRCKLMRCEAIDTECCCAFARGEDYRRISCPSRNCH